MEIFLTKHTIIPSICWFRQVLNHPGQARLFATIVAGYYQPQLRHYVISFVCDACQRYKIDGIGCDSLAVQEVRLAPWTEVFVDLIGPWTFVVGNTKYTFNALTSIGKTISLVFGMIG